MFRIGVKIAFKWVQTSLELVKSLLVTPHGLADARDNFLPNWKKKCKKLSFLSPYLELVWKLHLNDTNKSRISPCDNSHDFVEKKIQLGFLW